MLKYFLMYIQGTQIPKVGIFSRGKAGDMLSVCAWRREAICMPQGYGRL